VENDEFASFTRRVLRAYARRVAQGDIEALNGLRQLASEVDAATADAVAGLRGFGYSWAEISRRVGVTRQAAQMRWGNATERRRIDERVRNGGQGLSVNGLVVVFADHFRADPLTGSCPGCGHRYSGDADQCPTVDVVAPMLFRRRHEDRTALRLLTPAQFCYLHGRRGTTPSQLSSVPTSADSGPSLFETTGGRCE
jgi:hypothetical protein